MIRRLFASSRFFITLAVLGTLISSFGLLIYGLLTAARIILHTATEGVLSSAEAKALEVDLIELTDLFLLGTILYIVAIGLYRLFLDESVPLPAWLKIGSLDELKDRLLGGIVVLLAVSFLADSVTEASARDILAEGIGMAAVIVGLGVYGVLSHRHEQLPPPRVADVPMEPDSASAPQPASAGRDVH